MNTTAGVSVKRSIVVEASQERAFDVFVNQFATWWPLDSHVLGEAPGQTAIIEPHTGGRWFERDKNGQECRWGRVLAFDPFGRILLDWQISGAWKYDPQFHTEVEVTFTPESPTRTRVELEHRDLQNYGDDCQKLKETFESPGGWTGLMERYAERF